MFTINAGTDFVNGNFLVLEHEKKKKLLEKE